MESRRYPTDLSDDEWQCISPRDVLWARYLLSTGSSYPSLADLAYLAGIPFFVVGLLLLGRGTIGRYGANLIDPLIIAVVAGMFSWTILMEPGVHTPTSSLLERLLSVTNLFTYVVLLTILVRTLFRDCPVVGRRKH